MSTQSVEDRRVAMDDTAVRVVRALMSWHNLAMPDIAAAIGHSIGTIERRLSRRPETRKSWQAWELDLLAEYFGVEVSVFYSGNVDIKASHLATGTSYPGKTRQYLVGNAAELIAA